METDLLIAIIGSSVISSLVTAIFAKKKQSKEHMIIYITKERQKWREFIRRKIVDFIHSENWNEKRRIYSEIKLNLNPYDNEDKNLLDKANNYLESNNSKFKEEILELSSQLLKEDWERVKKETYPKINIYSLLLNLIIIYIVYRFFMFDQVLIDIMSNIKSYDVLKILDVVLAKLIIIFTILVIVKVVKTSFKKLLPYEILNFLDIPSRGKNKEK